MKNIKILPVALVTLLLAALLFSGCGVILVPKGGEAGTGEKETRHYDFSGFTNIEIGDAFEYEVEQSDAYSISITANNRLFDDISVEKEGQTLVIDMTVPGIPWSLVNIGPSSKVVITMPRLEELDASGATGGTVTGFDSDGEMDITVSGASELELEDIAAADINLYVSGSSDVDLDITAEDVYFNISGASGVEGDIEAKNLEIVLTGSSDIRLDGTATDMTVHTSGASGVKLAGLETVNADIVFSGASDGTVNVSGRLDVDLSGASSLDCIGNPELGEITIATSSDFNRK
jgi:hypothetical protein